MVCGEVQEDLFLLFIGNSHSQTRLPAATGEASSGAIFIAPANSLQLTRIGRYITSFYM